MPRATGAFFLPRTSAMSCDCCWCSSILAVRSRSTGNGSSAEVVQAALFSRGRGLIAATCSPRDGTRLVWGFSRGGPGSSGHPRRCSIHIFSGVVGFFYPSFLPLEHLLIFSRHLTRDPPEAGDGTARGQTPRPVSSCDRLSALHKRILPGDTRSPRGRLFACTCSTHGRLRCLRHVKSPVASALGVRTGCVPRVIHRDPGAPTVPPPRRRPMRFGSGPPLLSRRITDRDLKPYPCENFAAASRATTPSYTHCINPTCARGLGFVPEEKLRQTPLTSRANRCSCFLHSLGDRLRPSVSSSGHAGYRASSPYDGDGSLQTAHQAF